MFLKLMALFYTSAPLANSLHQSFVCLFVFPPLAFSRSDVRKNNLWCSYACRSSTTFLSAPLQTSMWTLQGALLPAVWMPGKRRPAPSLRPPADSELSEDALSNNTQLHRRIRYSQRTGEGFNSAALLHWPQVKILRDGDSAPVISAV